MVELERDAADLVGPRLRSFEKRIPLALEFERSNQGESSPPGVRQSKKADNPGGDGSRSVLTDELKQR